MKKYKGKIIVSVLVAAVLIFTFWWGGNAPNLSGADTNDKKASASENIENTPKEKPEIIKADEKAQSREKSNEKKDEKADYTEKTSKETNAETKNDIYQTEPVSEGKPAPVEPEEAVISKKALSCTISVSCKTILNNIEYFDKNKIDIVPKDGIILAEKSAVFYEGESVFNLLVREMKKNKIHLEFVNTPIYNSAYIEGIANIYEFDCGSLSGWMYKVNDWFPNYGCSRYQLKDGDKVEWVYSCNLGRDVGAENYSGGQKE